ncbi:hypothetical protein [Desulfoplanes formicivorans]|uniref:Uncharacterized protein n=1 Tax=Desulfoplanes formicivorans TaxID=1592317 RepID=A0A194ALP1_9BACT|nr:hypothetical protein [Desulfoplanes formicivorans]GAU09946.1 hypothetical protein DPF_2682 [Desulfoplanes formicivorans]
MFLTDLKDQRWKVTLDANGIVYFYVQDMIGREPRVEIPARELARYYELESEAKQDFVQTLGRRIGIPFWPMFVDRIIEPERQFATQLGLFGRMANKDILEEDLLDLIVPLPKDQALEQHPHLIPDETACQEYEALAARIQEAICSSAVCAMACPLFRDDEYKTSVYVTKAQLEIESCVICNSPATAVGVFQPRQSDEDIIILHGLCKRCKPKEPCSPKQIEKIGQAIDALEKQGRIQKIQCPLPEA